MGLDVTHHRKVATADEAERSVDDHESTFSGHFLGKEPLLLAHAGLKFVHWCFWTVVGDRRGAPEKTTDPRKGSLHASAKDREPLDPNVSECHPICPIGQHCAGMGSGDSVGQLLAVG